MPKGFSHYPREDLIRIARFIYEKGFATAQAGNVSCRLRGDRVLIKATGASLGFLTDEDLVVLDMDGSKVEGEKEPSSEWRMHLAIYKARPDIGAVVHTHSVYASVLAYLKRHIKPVNPESHYILGDIPRVPYFKFGTEELAQAVTERLGRSKAVLLERHGVVTLGEDLEGAYFIAELVEEVSKITYLVDLFGKKRPWSKLVE